MSWDIVSVLLVESIIFILLSYLFQWIKGFGLYNWMLDNSKHPIYGLVSFKEKIAYVLTKIVWGIPTFSFAPVRYEESNLRISDYKGIERVYIILGSLFNSIRSILSNLAFDLIIVVTYLCKKNAITLDQLLKRIIYYFDIFVSTVNTSIIIEVLKWVYSNANLLLIIVIIVVLMYVWTQKRRINKYAIEAAWAEEDAERAKLVAKYQKKIEDSLSKLSSYIYRNLRNIDQCIHFNVYDGERVTIYLEDYAEILEEIEDALLNISKVGGTQIYNKRNYKMFIQLSILDLVPPLTPKKELYLYKFNCLSKNTISNLNTREKLCSAYAEGVACLNGIYRFLKFSNKKRRQYNSLVQRIADSTSFTEILKSAQEK